ncbi:MAG: hypothetical protein ACYCPW_02600, partial [Nitrososphaerales archaeon]
KRKVQSRRQLLHRMSRRLVVTLPKCLTYNILTAHRGWDSRVNSNAVEVNMERFPITRWT